MVSCIDEPFYCPPQDGYITFGGIHTRDFDPSNPTHDGTMPDDYIVQTLRIIAFKSDGNKETVKNELLNVAGSEIRFQLPAGSYDFVFLANEPSLTSILTALNGISKFSDLNEIAYPATAFDSNALIPMRQVITDVELLAGGKVKLNDGTLKDINDTTRGEKPEEGLYKAGSEIETVILRLDRLAVRLNVILKSEFDLTDDFESLVLTGIPDLVPLFQADYRGTITRNVTRTYPNSRFTDLSSGSDWVQQLDRIVIPSNHFAPVDGTDNATTLTVKLKGEKYSPDCKLKILDDNYNLPYNTMLDFTGTIKEPLDVNIVAKPWDTEYINWETDQLYLNVSQTDINITDFNGARITFESNAPIIRITGYYKSDGSFSDWVGGTFNLLQWGSGDWNRRYKYTYDSIAKMGSGYMDIIVNNNENAAGLYRLVLTARRKESWDNPGGMTLSRELKINVKQEGVRNIFSPGSNSNLYAGEAYVGAFYKNNETGERIIQNRLDCEWWEASVPDIKEGIPGSGNPKDWIILSSTPSFDPKVGTMNPGNAEDYPVVPNYYRGEDGSKVTAADRIYFRIGLRSVNPNPDKPRYGYVDFRYTKKEPKVFPVADVDIITVKIKNENGEEIGTEQEKIKKMRIYVRQGEADDIVLDATSEIINAPGHTRNGICKFSPYNVTVQDMLDNYSDRTKNYLKVDSTQRDPSRTTTFVEYPSQGGALFQWSVPNPDYRWFAYYSRTLSDYEFTDLGDIPNAVWAGSHEYGEQDPFWDAPSLGISFKDYGEVCPKNPKTPKNYRRPNNGIVDGLAKNRTIDEVVKSEFLSSLFQRIPVGDAHQDIPDTYPNNSTDPNGIVRYKPDSIENVVSGLYADGFFDRYPRQIKTVYYNSKGESSVIDGVCLGDARAAFRGNLFYNPITFASLFLPAAGRRDAAEGGYQYGGGTGFYLTSSLGNQWKNDKGVSFKNIWQMELSYHPAAISAVPNFASSVRCVVDE